MTYFFDTYAIIEIVKENKNYQKYKEEEIITSILNLGELYFYLLKNFDRDVADKWKTILEGCYLTITEDIIIKAMKFRLKNKSKDLSFIDCVGYILSKENNMKLLTGDKEFKDLPNVEFVK